MTAPPVGPLAPPTFQGPTTSDPLVALFQSVEAYFTVTQTQSKVFLGLKYRDTWDTSRVVIIDGEFDGSPDPKPRSAGRFVAPWQKQSVNPRELVGWERPVTLSIRAVDATNPDSEQAQTAAMTLLMERTIQAVHNALALDVDGNVVAVGQASIDWSGSKAIWVDPGTGTQQTWGKELLVGFVYKCVFFDGPLQVLMPRPTLAKQLLDRLEGGRQASIATALPAGTSVISGLGLCTPAMVGQNLALSGAATIANNGAFPIAYFLSPTSLIIRNPSAVVDANNGSIVWRVVPPA